MSNQNNLAAFTALTPHPYPDYISVNLIDGDVAITVRARPKSDGSCGDSATITLTAGDFRGVFEEALKEFSKFQTRPHEVELPADLQREIFLDNLFRDALARQKGLNLDGSVRRETYVPQLAPCPFCGSTNVDPEGWASLEHSGPACDDCSGSAETVELWNRSKWCGREVVPGLSEAQARTENRLRKLEERSNDTSVLQDRVDALEAQVGQRPEPELTLEVVDEPAPSPRDCRDAVAALDIDIEGAIIASRSVQLSRPSAFEVLVMEAVARGWCHDANREKEMDSDLAEAISREVAKLFGLPRAFEGGIVVGWPWKCPPPSTAQGPWPVPPEPTYHTGPKGKA